jgi:hypothetical protein
MDTSLIILEDQITKYLDQYNRFYIKIDNIESIQNIHNLLINDIHFKPSVSQEYLYYGIYYADKKDYKLMKKYYSECIEDNSDAMYNLGTYYNRIINDYSKAKKYYLMAIEKHHSTAMNNLAYYYYAIENNHDLMKKYYLMAIENNNIGAMCNLADYYKTLEDYDLMKKYYFMAIENGNSIAMGNLAYYYETIENNYDLMEKYYIDAIEKGNNKFARTRLINYYKNNNDILSSVKLYHKLNMNSDFFSELSKYFSKYNEVQQLPEILDIILNLSENIIDIAPLSIKIIYKLLKSNINIMDLHFKYSVEGKGFTEAKNDFLNQIMI